MGRERAVKDDGDWFHPYADNRKSKRENATREEKSEEDDDIYFFGTWYIPRHMVTSILQYLDLRTLVEKGLLINRKFYKLIVDDCDGILWESLCSTIWLKPMYHELKKSLALRKHKWMRFLSIFADNYNEWDYEPNYSPTLHSDFKLFSCTEDALDYSLKTNLITSETNTKQTVLYLGNPKNSSCSSTYPIRSKTVKCFNIRLDQKPSTSNVGVGLAEKAFLTLERKFVGFNPYNVGCSSNGKARCFFPSTCEKHQEERCCIFNAGDIISVIVDMLGNRVEYYVSGKFSYKFENVDFRLFDPYRVTVTMFSSGDQFSFVSTAPFETSTLLKIYDECEKTFNLYYLTLDSAKNEFINVAEQFIGLCEDKSFILKTKESMQAFIDSRNKD